MAKKEQPDNHHMGKHTGYELKDGAYHMAPVYSERFDKLRDKREAINDLIKSLNNHILQVNQDIAHESNQLWDDLHDDLGLDPEKEWRYIYHTGCIVEVGKEEVVNG